MTNSNLRWTKLSFCRSKLQFSPCLFLNYSPRKRGNFIWLQTKVKAEHQPHSLYVESENPLLDLHNFPDHTQPHPVNAKYNISR